VEVCISDIHLCFDDPEGDLGACVEVLVQQAYEQVPGFAGQPGMQIIDGGANVGVYAIAQAKRGARVVAFEPNPLTFQRLKEHVARNSLQEAVLCVNAGLAGTSGTRILETSGKWHTAHLADAPSNSAVDVKVLSLDDALKLSGFERVDILKLDIEGAEEDFLRLAGEALDRVDSVVVERHYPHEVEPTLGARGFWRMLSASAGEVEFYGREVSQVKSRVR
jgi:FkbM family methyltransferase